MARTIDQIQSQMLDNIAADSVLSTQLTSTSKRAIYRLFTYIVAVAIAMLEQLIDVFTAAIEAMIAAAAPGTGPWLQNQIFNFQYSATNPQQILFNATTFAPYYPVVDTTLRIISRCSVTTNLANSVIVKVATGTTPAPLSAPQLAAVQSYVNLIGTEGITYSVISLNPDQLKVQAQIYYTGQYSSVISANVIQAINNFLSLLPFNGQMRVGDLTAAIRKVTGVSDVVLQNVIARADGTPIAQGTALVLNNAEVGRLWPTVSGYMIGETTAGSTFTDTLTFISE